MSQMSWYPGGQQPPGPYVRPPVATGALPPMEYPGEPIVGPAHVVAPVKARRDWKSYFLNHRTLVTVVGAVLLLMLCVVPVWNALTLLQDSNYVFWAGRTLPTWLLVLCAFLILMYIVTVVLFFRQAYISVQADQTIMMIANIFITLFGLILMLVALPLVHQADFTYNNLMHRCDFSEQTHRLYEYSQVLHNIRSQPDCLGKYSVEDCVGYEDAAPYTSFLKGMEMNFQCSGFCYRHLGNETAAAPAQVSLLSQKRRAGRRRQQQGHKPNPMALADGASLVERSQASVSYPPTLFSDANYQTSCEGMAARDMKNFAGEIGTSTFYQGIYLVLIAVTTGFLKLLGFCVRKDRDTVRAVREEPVPWPQEG